MQTVRQCFISLILTYKVMKKTTLLCCTSNQVGTGHKLNFQPKNQARGQIGSEQQQKLLWHGWGVMQTVQMCFISLILTYKVMKKTAVLCCTANQVGTGHKLHFQFKSPAMGKFAAINNKNVRGTAEVWCRQLDSVSYHWYYHIRSVNRQLCFVVPPTKLAQAISSILSRKIHLGPNWHQSST